jgi:hypothetical protein
VVTGTAGLDAARAGAEAAACGDDESSALPPQAAKNKMLKTSGIARTLDGRDFFIDLQSAPAIAISQCVRVMCEV